MVGFGRVIGGDYKNAQISTPVGSTLVVQAGLKFKKIVPANVVAWEEIPTDSKGNPVGEVGKAVAGALLPGQLGKAASAAVGATFELMGASHLIRIDWADGKRSLVKLPDSMFKHLELVLEAQRVEPTESLVNAEAPVAEKATVTDKAFDLVSGLIKDRMPAPKSPAAEVTATPQVDVAEQLHKLASLRDAGILTDEEFAAKKAELLARL